jgi:hypothetical protein
LNGEVDDPAPPLRLHDRHDRADAVEGGGQVDGDDPVPLVDREVLHRGDVLDAGVVDQDVQPTELVMRRGDHLGDLAGPGHVGAVVEGLDSVLMLDAAARRLDGGHLAQTVEDDIAALCGQGLRHGQADTAGGSGDDSRLAR